jgi:hypothetical protein
MRDNRAYVKDGPGRYRHLPTGYEIRDAVPGGRLWMVLDGGGHVAFRGSFAEAKAWVNKPDAVNIEEGL